MFEIAGMEAQVYKSTGSWYVTKTADGSEFNARMKGIFKIDGITSTNPIAVGDRVTIQMENELEGSVLITEILSRKNYIARQSPSHRNQHHIVAANLDQTLIVATLKDPRTSQGFIDRFLVTSEAYHIPAIIIFNKADIYKKKELQRFEEMKEMYERVGYKVFLVSILKDEGMEELVKLMKDRITLVSGHSGVGKSSFINRLLPDAQIKTKDVSGWSGKGMHTTTFAEMYDISNGGKIIDTPGMREFGLVDLSRQELSHYYPEMRALLQECQFNNCVHVNEPGCAIKDAVAEGIIHEDRFLSYLGILDTIEERKY